MNALVIIDTDALTPATVFAPGGVEGIISKLETDVRAIEQDISTEEGRKAVKSLAYKIARSKTALDDMGKELVADIKAKAGAIDAERRIIRDRCDALKEEVSGPLTAWEEAEADRIEKAESALVLLTTAARFDAPQAAQRIKDRIQSVKDVWTDHNWQEFNDRASVAAAEAFTALEVLLADAIQREADQAELAELRRLKAEREQEDRARAQEAIEAENARIRTEQAAERERLRTENAEADKIRAAAEAVEQERLRVTRAKDEADRATAKREANKRHVAKINKEIAQAINQALNGAQFSPERLVEAIAAGIIPHVSITY